MLTRGGVHVASYMLVLQRSVQGGGCMYLAPPAYRYGCIHNSLTEKIGTHPTFWLPCPQFKKKYHLLFRWYLVNRLTKVREILTKDTSTDSKCCLENSERLVFLNSLTNCLRKKCEFPAFREGVPENWMGPCHLSQGIMDATADCNILTDVFG